MQAWHINVPACVCSRRVLRSLAFMFLHLRVRMYARCLCIYAPTYIHDKVHTATCPDLISQLTFLEDQWLALRNQDAASKYTAHTTSEGIAAEVGA